MATKRLVQKKICLLGNFAVGKTSLIRRYVNGRFDDKYLSSIGVKISRKSISYDTYNLNLLIWDLAGGDDFSKIGQNYLRGTTAALIVCDLTRPETLSSFAYYASQLRAINPEAKLLFLGNKADLETERVILNAEIEKAIQPFAGSYLETSAKTGYQVELAFEQLAAQIEI